MKSEKRKSDENCSCALSSNIAKDVRAIEIAVAGLTGNVSIVLLFLLVIVTSSVTAAYQSLTTRSEVAMVALELSTASEKVKTLLTLHGLANTKAHIDDDRAPNPKPEPKTKVESVAGYQ